MLYRDAGKNYLKKCTELLSVFALCLCTKHRYCCEESCWNR